MRAVTNTSPLHYLILIEQVELLPLLYEQVIIPRAVIDELQHPRRRTSPNRLAHKRMEHGRCGVLKR